MDWDKNFSKIVRETESNLAKVKERLSAVQMSESLPELHTSALKGYTYSTGDGSTGSALMNVGFSSLRTPTLTSHETYGKDFRAHSDVYKSGGSALVNSDQSSMITLLHDKIDAQEKTIQALVQSVKRLEDEKDHYLRQVQELRDDFAKLHSRVVERGIDLQTERKMEHWKQDMAAQISALQSQMSHSRRNEENNTTYHGNQTANIVRDIHDLKRFVSSECDSLKYNIEGVKTRIGRMETDIHSSSSSHRGFSPGHPGVDQLKIPTMQHFLNGQPTLQQSASFKSDTDISYLKGSVHSLRERLHSMESDIRLASSSKVTEKHTQKAAPKTTPTFSKHAQRSSYLASLDLDDSVGEDNKLDDPGELSLDELDDSKENLLDDTGSIDLDDVHTANTIDLNLSDDEPSDSDLEGDEPINDHELSIDDLS